MQAGRVLGTCGACVRRGGKGGSDGSAAAMIPARSGAIRRGSGRGGARCSAAHVARRRSQVACRMSQPRTTVRRTPYRTERTSVCAMFRLREAPPASAGLRAPPQACGRSGRSKLAHTSGTQGSGFTVRPGRAVPLRLCSLPSFQRSVLHLQPRDCAACATCAAPRSRGMCPLPRSAALRLFAGEGHPSLSPEIDEDAKE